MLISDWLLTYHVTPTLIPDWLLTRHVTRTLIPDWLTYHKKRVLDALIQAEPFLVGLEEVFHLCSCLGRHVFCYLRPVLTYPSQAWGSLSFRRAILGYEIFSQVSEKNQVREFQL